MRLNTIVAYFSVASEMSVVSAKEYQDFHD